MARKADTVSNRLRTLNTGESYTVSKRISMDDVRVNIIRETLATMRNSLGVAVNRLKVEDDLEYTIETGSFTTHDGSAIIAVVSVTMLSDLI